MHMRDGGADLVTRWLLAGAYGRGEVGRVVNDR
jgi:hypothetical protein